jgi:hypothetical protein
MTIDDQSTPTDTGASLDHSSAMLRTESDYLPTTLRALVARLESVPSLNVRVVYHHGRIRRLIGDLPYVNDLHRRSAPIASILVTVGPYSYWLQSDQVSIRCGRSQLSFHRGEAGDTLSFSAWAEALFEAIAGQNLVNHDSMVALRQLIEQDQAL